MKPLQDNILHSGQLGRMRANVIAALKRSNKTEPLEAIRARHWQHIDSQSIRDTAVCVYILRPEHAS